MRTNARAHSPSDFRDLGPLIQDLLARRNGEVCGLLAKVIPLLRADAMLTEEEKIERTKAAEQEWREQQMAARRRALMKRSGLTPRMILELEMNPFIARTESQQLVDQKANEWVADPPKITDIGPRGMFIAGPEGVGKSHKLRQSARDLVMTKSPPVRALYIPGPKLNTELYNDIKRGDDETTYKQIVLEETDVIFLDDLFKALTLDCSDYIFGFYSTLLDQIDATKQPMLWAAANVPIEEIAASFRSSGGGWLVDRFIRAVEPYWMDGPNGRIGCSGNQR